MRNLENKSEKSKDSVRNLKEMLELIKQYPIKFNITKPECSPYHSSQENTSKYNSLSYFWR